MSAAKMWFAKEPHGEEMLDFVQQVIGGIALGCVYGLIALGFVLIYKATEVVNFAQGEIMMLGAFLSFTFIATLGLNYWFGFLLCVVSMAVLGAAMERLVVRPILGYPQFSIVMATIGLGLVIRSLVGIIWGTDDLRIETPFTGGVIQLGGLVLSQDSLSIIVATALLCAVLYAFFRFTKIGIAMQATSQNMLAAYYMGIPVKRMFSLIWSLSAIVACCAGVLLAPITFIHANLGFLGIKAFPAACSAVSAASLARSPAASRSASSNRCPASICRRASRMSPPMWCCSRCCCGDHRACSAATR